MTSLLAILAFLPVLPLQLLGDTGTCTQNDTDPFLVGAVLSVPFGLGAILLTLVSMTRIRSRPREAGHRLAGLSSLVLAALAAISVSMNHELARDTLLLGVSPCGADHTEPGRRFEPENVLIGCAYVLVPLIVLGMAVACFRASRPKRGRGR